MENDIQYLGRRNGKHQQLMQRLDSILQEKGVVYVFTKEELKKHNIKVAKLIINEIKTLGAYKKDLYLIEEQDLKNILKKHGG